MSPFGLKFSQMVLHTETSKLMYIWSFIFVVLHKPTLLPSTFNEQLYENGNNIMNSPPPPNNFIDFLISKKKNQIQ